MPPVAPIAQVPAKAPVLLPVLISIEPPAEALAARTANFAAPVAKSTPLRLTQLPSVIEVSITHLSPAVPASPASVVLFLSVFPTVPGFLAEHIAVFIEPDCLNIVVAKIVS
ncbi:hypothetical protein R83H12_02746 [Fibrobacteria bacterium R8-3-H12]